MIHLTLALAQEHPRAFLQRQYLVRLNSVGFASFQHHGYYQLTINKFSVKVSDNRVDWLEHVSSFAYGQLVQGSTKVQVEGR